MEYKRVIISGIIVIVLTVALALAAGGNIEGTVIESETDDPMPGVLITLEDPESNVVEYSVVTNHNGIFHFWDVRPGSYSLVVAAIDYDSLTTTITIEDGESYELSYTLQPCEE